MANSTYREACNRVAALHGQLTCADNTTFDGTVLDKIYVQIKQFFWLANQMYGRAVRTRFLIREFYLDITDAANSYTVNATTSPDRLVPDTWYISTSGYGKRLRAYPGGYAAWKRTYPEGETVEGIPDYFVILPQTGDDVERVAFSPPADRNLRVYYSGYLKPVPLAAAADLIIWPKDFEDAIMLGCGQFVEFASAEGKMPDIASFIEPAMSLVEASSQGPEEDTKMFDLGIEIDIYG